MYRASPRFKSGVDPGRALREGHVLDRLEGAEAEARRRAGLHDAQDVGVEVLHPYNGSQEVAVSAQVGDVGADEEARGPADGLCANQPVSRVHGAPIILHEVLYRRERGRAG